MTIPLGTIYISSTDSYQYKFNVVIDQPDLYEKSNDQLYIGGLGLTTYTKGNKSFISVILDQSFQPSNVETIISGMPLQLASKNNQYTLLVNENSSDNIAVDNGFVYNGIPLSTNANKEIIFVEADVSVSGDEDIEIYWGGMPLIARRVGLDWYLVVYNAGGSSSTLRWFTFSVNGWNSFTTSQWNSFLP